MARLGKRERAAKRALCASNRRIVRDNTTHGVRDDSRQVIRKHDGSLSVVSGRGTSSDHFERLQGHSATRGFSEARTKMRDLPKEYIPAKWRK